MIVRRPEKRERSEKIKIGTRKTDFLITHQEVSLSGKYRLHMNSSKDIMTNTREG